MTYWDAIDGQAIRVVDGGDMSMSSLDIEPEGEFFVSGSDDKLLKVNASLLYIALFLILFM